MPALLRRRVVFIQVLAAVLALGVNAHAQSVYQYQVTDPMVGASVADLNTVFWQWSGPGTSFGCAPSSVSVSSNGLSLSGEISSLGVEQRWAIRGDFRATIFASVTPGARVHFSVAEYSAANPAVSVAVHAITGNASTHPGAANILAVTNGGTYFLFRKQGGTLSILQGDAASVNDASLVVASGPVAADGHYVFYAQTGCPALGGTILLRDFALQAESIVPRTSGRAEAPSEWLAAAAQSALEAQVAALLQQVSTLTADNGILQGQVATLTAQNALLVAQANVCSAENSALTGLTKALARTVLGVPATPAVLARLRDEVRLEIDAAILRFGPTDGRIREAQRKYHDGVAALQAGNLAAAEREFRSAFHLANGNPR